MYSNNELIRLYKKETNIKVKERLLLVIIKVKYDNIIPAYASDELHIEVDPGDYIGWIDSYKKE